MTRLGEWQVILAQAAADAMQREGEEWRPNGHPFEPEPKKLHAPCVIVYPGGREKWFDPEEGDRTYCSVPAFYSLALIAGRVSRATHEQLPVMVERIYGLPALVKADPRAAGLKSTPKIGVVSPPYEFDEVPGQTLLACSVEVSFQIHRPAAP